MTNKKSVIDDSDLLAERLGLRSGAIIDNIIKHVYDNLDSFECREITNTDFDHSLIRMTILVVADRWGVVDDDKL